ncbi:MAG: hypothetical protein A2402_01040 [Candidatus Staskawiczbacteria bacterium RIFOXYC1_FULL_37_43]|nr:MAG: hypothetical protein A2813_00435 [Candidatus Staskawiczbacteria bacterium RIFCSPHIGHO2_01_FULL_37_17]OGZ71326.1 MAG: hypothetical protein A2891_02940 [Candidatus Staskawiczbacteria bacterium RIFCSPLOWO2_01_FULL_37_19]OGZ75901.1 MAG: hypothetical protein A2205_02140 [Candidatus Staskawiczbacteria bacterium RIFOXYA1_FULL_37_15]OGZ77590.1 MAG: hypothetical protein A2280_00600 [Candidatus Staskawiczbacteria bacterium RIFOXYA12_FULL_37_10]OGZ80789.1 MAG: hypothetical protein A2353_00940 [Can
MDKFNFLAKNKLDNLPKTSGVYLFYAKNNKTPIYIGKAISIKNRVKNHFQGKNWWEKTLLRQACLPARQGFGGQVGYFETNSEIEALILEANLIKKYQPKYNVMWRDDKNYFYVAIAKNENEIPYVFITHQKNQKKTEYVGPFTEGTALKKTLRFLRRAFPYYSIKKHSKLKCAYCHLDLCPGPYEQLFAPRLGGLGAPNAFGEYKKNIKKLILILKGKRKTVLNSLRKEMKQLAKNREFEKAGKIRDEIYALQQVMQHTHVISGNEISGNEYDEFLPYGKNSYSPGFKTLQKIVGIKNDINRIECYDVSNIQGKQATGSMIVFINGKPDKNQYRKFRIKMENEPNDIAMLKETISRRLQHSEWPYPEIMLIDGGKGQLNAAIAAKSEILNPKSETPARIGCAEGVAGGNSKFEIQNIKVVSIAKGGQELFIEGKNKPIPLKSLPQEIYNLILQLDSEAHRFAISYHKNLRKKNLMP